MSPFTRFLNDTVFIENLEGERIGPYKTAISSQDGFSASFFEESLDVEVGWKLARTLPNSREEYYTILEVNYSQGLSNIPPCWMLKLRKDDSLAPKNRSNTTINIANSSGIQIGDQNIQHIANGFIGLVERIEASNATPQDKSKAKSLLRSVLENPTVAAVLGSAAAGALALLG
jgi:RIP homotypic interaction motif